MTRDPPVNARNGHLVMHRGIRKGIVWIQLSFGKLPKLSLKR